MTHRTALSLTILLTLLTFPLWLVFGPLLEDWR